jgi:hypothetical protein
LQAELIARDPLSCFSTEFLLGEVKRRRFAEENVGSKDVVLPKSHEQIIRWSIRAAAQAWNLRDPDLLTTYNSTNPVARARKMAFQLSMEHGVSIKELASYFTREESMVRNAVRDLPKAIRDDPSMSQRYAAMVIAFHEMEKAFQELTGK